MGELSHSDLSLLEVKAEKSADFSYHECQPFSVIPADYPSAAFVRIEASLVPIAEKDWNRLWVSTEEEVKS